MGILGLKYDGEREKRQKPEKYIRRIIMEKEKKCPECTHRIKKAYRRRNKIDDKPLKQNRRASEGDSQNGGE